MSKQDMTHPTSTFPTKDNTYHFPEVSPSGEQIQLEMIKMKISMAAYLLVG
jgi:hypothetical protein